MPIELNITSILTGDACGLNVYLCLLMSHVHGVDVVVDAAAGLQHQAAWVCQVHSVSHVRLQLSPGNSILCICPKCIIHINIQILRTY